MGMWMQTGELYSYRVLCVVPATYATNGNADAPYLLVPSPEKSSIVCIDKRRAVGNRSTYCTHICTVAATFAPVLHDGHTAVSCTIGRIGISAQIRCTSLRTHVSKTSITRQARTRATHSRLPQKRREGGCGDFCLGVLCFVGTVAHRKNSRVF